MGQNSRTPDPFINIDFPPFFTLFRLFVYVRLLYILVFGRVEYV